MMDMSWFRRQSAAVKTEEVPTQKVPAVELTPAHSEYRAAAAEFDECFRAIEQNNAERKRLEVNLDQAKLRRNHALAKLGQAGRK
jgi:hypothetical protein